MPTKNQLYFLQYTISNMDDIILTAPQDTLINSYTVPSDHIIFEGRCKDITSLHFTNKLQQKYSFICLQTMDYTSIVNNSNDNSSFSSLKNGNNSNNDDDTEPIVKQNKPILKVSSLSQLNTSTGLHTGFLTASTLIQTLHHKFQTCPSNMLTIFCSNTVHDSIHYFAMNHSIILVK